MLENRISDYRILEKLGEGGMGEVYLAKQEQPVRRKVAIKIIKPGMDSKEIIARFESERQALAMMNHPNIAKVFDAGSTEQGRPYFVMEHVPGIPLTDYCDRHRLGTLERLELFLPLCRAIHHAHQKGILHRDLKPSNVLVVIQDGQALSKVIDFGLAKALHQPLTDLTVFTKQGGLMGTPAYMSPEQAEMTGLNIDTTTDIYSLGVLLYELLVGVLPFDSNQLLKDGIEGMSRQIREETPSRPSTRISEMGEEASAVALQRGTIPQVLEGQLEGDLDWITMKAMEKDRTRRYQSASEFAEDIGRYLRKEPVVARPPSTSYRFKRWVARHKVGVAAGALVFLALVLGLVGTTIGFIRATRAEETARQEAMAAEKVTEFLVGLFEVSDPGESRGNSVTAREILDKGAEKIQEELVDQPLLKARLESTIGRVYLLLGLYDQARPLLEEALVRRRDLLGEKHPDVAVSLNQVANLLVETGDYEAALPLHEQALSIWEEVLGPDDLNVALSLDNLANLHKQKGNYTIAQPLYERSLAIRERALGPDDPDVSHSLNNLANLYSVTGDYDNALPLYERAIAIKERTLGGDHPDLAANLSNLANVYFHTGSLVDAKRLYKRALSIQEKVMGLDHPEVAVTLNNLGELQLKTGEYDESRVLFKRAQEIWERKLGPDHPYLGYSLHNLANVAVATGDLEQALLLYQGAQQIWEEKLGSNHPNVAENLERLALLLHKMGRNEEADQLEERAKSIRAQYDRPATPN